MNRCDITAVTIPRRVCFIISNGNTEMSGPSQNLRGIYANMTENNMRTIAEGMAAERQFRNAYVSDIPGFSDNTLSTALSNRRHPDWLRRPTRTQIDNRYAPDQWKRFALTPGQPHYDLAMHRLLQTIRLTPEEELQFLTSFFVRHCANLELRAFVAKMAEQVNPSPQASLQFLLSDEYLGHSELHVVHVAAMRVVDKAASAVRTPAQAKAILESRNVWRLPSIVARELLIPLLKMLPSKSLFTLDTSWAIHRLVDAEVSRRLADEPSWNLLRYHTLEESKAEQRLLNEGKFPETQNQWNHLLSRYNYDSLHPAIIDKYINNGATSSRAQLNENPLYVQGTRSRKHRNQLAEAVRRAAWQEVDPDRRLALRRAAAYPTTGRILKNASRAKRRRLRYGPL